MMQRIFTLLLCATLTLGWTSCSDSYDDSALREQIADLEDRIAATEAVLAAYNKGLFIQSVKSTSTGYEIVFSDGSKATIRNGKDGQPGSAGANGDSWIKEVIVGKTEVTFVMTDGTRFSMPLATLVQKIQHLSFLSATADGSAEVLYTSPANSRVEMSFQLSPRELATEFTSVWSEYFRFEAVLTEVRGELVTLPVTKCVINGDTGILTLEGSAEALGTDFFSGKMQAAAALTISDGASSFTSNYVPLKAVADPAGPFSLYNKKIAILGDSYSTYGGWIPEGYATWYAINGVDGNNSSKNDVSSVSDTWWHQLMTRYNCQLLMNSSYSGAPVSYSGYKTDENPTGYEPAAAFITRMRTDLSNKIAPEVILVLGGTNDHYAGAPLGEVKYADWSEEELKSFAPAMCYMFDYLKRTHPKATIFNIQNDCFSTEEAAMIATVTAHYEIPNILLSNIKGSANLQGGHPTKATMTRIADQVDEGIHGAK